jgi:hypothetical protein
MTATVGRSCTGYTACNFVVDAGVIGDPAPGCEKTFTVRYHCGSVSAPYTATLPPGAGAKREIINIACNSRQLRLSN